MDAGDITQVQKALMEVMQLKNAAQEECRWDEDPSKKISHWEALEAQVLQSARNRIMLIAFGVNKILR